MDGLFRFGREPFRQRLATFFRDRVALAGPPPDPFFLDEYPPQLHQAVLLSIQVALGCVPHEAQAAADLVGELVARPRPYGEYPE
jgi:hypothetical protein